MVKLPGLIDPHVHVREPGATHKEDWLSATQSALAGGFTAILAMPNTNPPVTDAQTMRLSLDAAKSKALCDYAQFLGAGPDNTQLPKRFPWKSAGLKMYLDHTYGPLRLDNMLLWRDHLKNWPEDMPIVAHAEKRTMAAVILLASLYDRPIHIAHVSLREEIELIRLAKERGVKVTCEVAPHHLFLSEEDIPTLGFGKSEVRPVLASKDDQSALWQNLAVIDVFATDHAPHTLAEKDSENPPPGFPGLETALPLLLTAVKERRLSLEDLVERMHTNPQKIFKLPAQPDTWIEIDLDDRWSVQGGELRSRCGWTPFEGWQVDGRVRTVTLRGKPVYREGQFLVAPGYGRNLRS